MRKLRYHCAMPKDKKNKKETPTVPKIRPRKASVFLMPDDYIAARDAAFEAGTSLSGFVADLVIKKLNSKRTA